jgi:hypothetical protein
MTHQVLDLSRPDALRGRTFPTGWFWLWEGLAIDAESLGDPPGRGKGAERLERFQRRRAWGEPTPLADLLRLPQPSFEGRHYDQVASLMRHLMGDVVPGSRAATLKAGATLLRGGRTPSFEETYGMPPARLDDAWRRAQAFR